MGHDARVLRPHLRLENADVLEENRLDLAVEQHQPVSVLDSRSVTRWLLPDYRQVRLHMLVAGMGEEEVRLARHGIGEGL